jgi:hypothetical protein
MERHMTQKRHLEVISQLLKETQEGKLKWEAWDPHGAFAPRPTGTVNIVGCFGTKRSGRMLRVTRYKTYVSHDGEDFFWDDFVMLELGDADGGVWWSFPEESMTWDLLRAVEAQLTDVEGFFDDILKP